MDLPLLVVFDASINLDRAFRDAGFMPYGKQRGAWVLPVDPDSEHARDLIYEMQGVGLKPQWRGRG